MIRTLTAAAWMMYSDLGGGLGLMSAIAMGEHGVWLPAHWASGGSVTSPRDSQASQAIPAGPRSGSGSFMQNGAWNACKQLAVRWLRTPVAIGKEVQ